MLSLEEYGNRNLITTKQMWIDQRLRDYLAKFAADKGIALPILPIQFVAVK